MLFEVVVNPAFQNQEKCANSPWYFLKGQSLYRKHDKSCTAYLVK
jgi:hypothetical protein